MKECINLKYLGDSIGRTVMEMREVVQEHTQVSVLCIWVDDGTITKAGNSGGAPG